jgi:hypothetical protein
VDKLEYLHECLIRNPNLREDILTFHQQFPPVFARERKRSNQNLREWLRSILEPSGIIDVSGNPLYVGRPQKIEDLKPLHSMSIQVEGFRILMVGEGKYCDAVKAVKAKKEEPYNDEYGRTLRTLLRKWPGVNRATFVHGIFEPYRPPLLVSGFPLNGGTLGVLKADLNRLADKVKIWIPVYEDTSSDDVDWGKIAGLQAFIYGMKRRARNDGYSRKLEIWDTYQELKNCAAVGRKLNLPRTTVEEKYISVFKDIMGINPPRRLREKRAAGTPKNHFQECTKCKFAKRVEDMCPAGRALVNINDVPQRERTGVTLKFEDAEFNIVDNLAVVPDEDGIISRIDEEKRAKRG